MVGSALKPLAVVAACPNAIPAKQRMPNTHNVIFIEFASDLEESRIKVRGVGLEFLLLLTHPDNMQAPYQKLNQRCLGFKRDLQKTVQLFAQSWREHRRHALAGAA